MPASSTSPTKIPSATPPATAPLPNPMLLPKPVNSGSIFFLIPLEIFLPACPVMFKYRPLLVAAIALLAKALPALNATPPGIPMLTINSVILPAVVASAISSNSVRSSKNFSTSAALFVSAPRSIKVAPSEKNPLGIDIIPEPIPANTDCNVLISLYSSCEIVLASLLLTLLLKRSLTVTIT